MDVRIENLLLALQKRRISCTYVADKEKAASKVLKMIPNHCTVGIGGSVTVAELAIEESLKEKGCTVFWHWRAQGKEAMDKTRRQAMMSDIYLSSTNAITEDGLLVNIDGTGNRVASMVYGPQKVIIIAGENKITSDLQEGLERIKKQACPDNARRLKKKTPCAATGECTDCDSPERMCNVTTIIEGNPSGVDLYVLIVGENLGY